MTLALLLAFGLLLLSLLWAWVRYSAKEPINPKRFCVIDADTVFVPSWIKNDPASKTVTMEIVADWNQVARYAKDNIRIDIIDFNGYWAAISRSWFRRAGR